VVMAAMRDLACPRKRQRPRRRLCARPSHRRFRRAHYVTLLAALAQRNLSRGIASLCIGGGEATAIAIERLTYFFLKRNPRLERARPNTTLYAPASAASPMLPFTSGSASVAAGASTGTWASSHAERSFISRDTNAVCIACPARTATT